MLDPLEGGGDFQGVAWEEGAEEEGREEGREDGGEVHRAYGRGVWDWVAERMGFVKAVGRYSSYVALALLCIWEWWVANWHMDRVAGMKLFWKRTSHCTIYTTATADAQSAERLATTDGVMLLFAGLYLGSAQWEVLQCAACPDEAKHPYDERRGNVPSDIETLHT